MTPHPHIIRLDNVDSTNTYLSGIASNSPHGTCVLADRQSAGRGQRGNTWESEPGKNLTFSVLLRPDGLHASQQFRISQAVSLAITDTLDGFLPEGIEAKVKWPNDIYVGNRKICGILIENTLCGAAIQHSIIGIGLNINQRDFLSDAPNPVSLYQLTRKDTCINDIYWKAYCPVSCNHLQTMTPYTTGICHRSGEETDNIIPTPPRTEIFSRRVSPLSHPPGTSHSAPDRLPGH